MYICHVYVYIYMHSIDTFYIYIYIYNVRPSLVTYASCYPKDQHPLRALHLRTARFAAIAGQLVGIEMIGMTSAAASSVYSCL